jgi:glycerol-3-phosphate O-acyltransferase
VFPEGGLTRDGLMREPRLGVVDYMLRGFWLDGARDLVFVPLGLNYDRVLEDRSLLKERGSTGRAKSLWITLRFVAHNVSLMLRSEWHRFGYACVNFGTPISMREYCRGRNLDFRALSGEERRAAMATLGQELMAAVGRIVPVLPVPLIASVFVAQPERALSALELKAEVGRLLARLEAAGAHVYIPRGDLDYALTVGLRMLQLRRLVEENSGLFRAREPELPLLAYYANSIAHLL